MQEIRNEKKIKNLDIDALHKKWNSEKYVNSNYCVVVVNGKEDKVLLSEVVEYLCSVYLSPLDMKGAEEKDNKVMALLDTPYFQSIPQKVVEDFFRDKERTNDNESYSWVTQLVLSDAYNTLGYIVRQGWLSVNTQLLEALCLYSEMAEKLPNTSLPQRMRILYEALMIVPTIAITCWLPNVGITLREFDAFRGVLKKKHSKKYGSCVLYKFWNEVLKSPQSFDAVSKENRTALVFAMLWGDLVNHATDSDSLFFKQYIAYTLMVTFGVRKELTELIKGDLLARYEIVATLDSNKATTSEKLQVLPKAFAKEIREIKSDPREIPLKKEVRILKIILSLQDSQKQYTVDRLSSRITDCINLRVHTIFNYSSFRLYVSKTSLVNKLKASPYPFIKWFVRNGINIDDAALKYAAEHSDLRVCKLLHRYIDAERAQGYVELCAKYGKKLEEKWRGSLNDVEGNKKVSLSSFELGAKIQKRNGESIDVIIRDVLGYIAQKEPNHLDIIAALAYARTIKSDIEIGGIYSVLSDKITREGNAREYLEYTDWHKTSLKDLLTFICYWKTTRYSGEFITLLIPSGRVDVIDTLSRFFYVHTTSFFQFVFWNRCEFVSTILQNGHTMSELIFNTALGIAKENKYDEMERILKRHQGDKGRWKVMTVSHAESFIYCHTTSHEISLQSKYGELVESIMTKLYESSSTISNKRG